MTPTATASPETTSRNNPINSAPPDFDPARELPAGFMDFFLPLHRRFTPRQQELTTKRAEVLQRSLEGEKPKHRYPSDTVRNGWKIALARVVPGPAQPDDRPGGRCRAGA